MAVRVKKCDMKKEIAEKFHPGFEFFTRERKEGMENRREAISVTQ